VRNALVYVGVMIGATACGGDWSSQVPADEAADKADGAAHRPGPHLRLAAFIGCPLVEGPFSWFAGDVRALGEPGSSRMAIDVRLDLDAPDGIGDVQVTIGETVSYAHRDVVASDDGCGAALVPGALASDRDTASDDGVAAWGTWLSRSDEHTGILRVSFLASASNPLEPLAPEADVTFDVDLDVRGGQIFEVRAQGQHDGYPSYELMLDGRILYGYDSDAAGKGPLAMFPPLDVDAEVDWIAP
jgi:hypothetical protein